MDERSYLSQYFYLHQEDSNRRITELVVSILAERHFLMMKEVKKMTLNLFSCVLFHVCAPRTGSDILWIFVNSAHMELVHHTVVK